MIQYVLSFLNTCNNSNSEDDLNLTDVIEHQLFDEKHDNHNKNSITTAFSDEIILNILLENIFVFILKNMEVFNSF